MPAPRLAQAPLRFTFYVSRSLLHHEHRAGVAEALAGDDVDVEAAGQARAVYREVIQAERIERAFVNTSVSIR